MKKTFKKSFPDPSRNPVVAAPSYSSNVSEKIISGGRILVLVLLGIIAYYNSFQGVFVFDDYYLFEKVRLHHLWPLGDVLGYTNRPLLNLSLTVNFALGKDDPAGYHLFNLFIHIAASLVLFGFLRRMFLSPGLVKHYKNDANALALVISAIWIVHPLNTASVTYIIQRAEAMMGLFYLLTLYLSVRYFVSRNRFTAFGAIMACTLGMATKEVMVTAPLLVLLTERFFFGTSFKNILQQKRNFYAALSITWGLLFFLLISYQGQFETVGLGLKNMTALDYAKSQPEIIWHYIKLALWPAALCFDYLWPVATNPGQIIVPFLSLMMLLALIGWAVYRFPEWGYWGCWFFVILAVSSSIFPLQDLAFEHRMYLPLIAIIACVVLAWHKTVYQNQKIFNWRIRLTWLAIVLTIFFLVYRTNLRNRDYHSSIRIWQDVIKQRPENYRAYNELGLALVSEQRWDEAQEAFKKSLAIKPDFIKPIMNMGFLKASQKKLSEAGYYFTDVLKKQPHNAEAYFNLGMLNMQQQNYEQAIKYYQEAIHWDPQLVGAYNNLGFVLLLRNQLREAREAFLRVTELDPGDDGAYINLGLISIKEGDLTQAKVLFEKAYRLNPRNPVVIANLGQIHLQLGEDVLARRYFALIEQMKRKLIDQKRDPEELLNPLFHVPLAGPGQHQLPRALPVD